MTEYQSSRTLVKSAPELWAECSDAASLARHLGAFGEIRITKLEPETTVAWEGAAASGTVRLETSGWGTRVTLTVTQEESPEPVAAEPDPAPAAVAEPEPEPEPEALAPEPAEPVEEPEPEPVAEPEPVPRAGRFARFRQAFRRKPVPVIEPEAVPDVEPEAEAPAATEPEVPALAEDPAPPELSQEPEPASDPEPASEPQPPSLSGEDALLAALDSLGMAHHRPYSRA